MLLHRDPKAEKPEKPDAPKGGRPGTSRWVQGLAAIGAVSLLAAIITLFLPLGRRASELHPTLYPAVESREFLTAVAALAGAPVRSGGTVRLLNNGDAFFPELLSAIRGAERSINLEVFIWEKGDASDQVFAALIERAGAGVPVRLLLDGFGCMHVPEEGVKALRAAGGRVEFFRSPRFGKLTRAHRRTHRRAIVIDGTVAFTGGMAISDKWVGNADTDDHWRDTMVEVTGPLAATVQTAFVAPWAQSTGEILIGDAFYPPQPPVMETPGLPVLQHVGIASSPSDEDHPLRVFLMQTFLSARKTLYITTPYFVPDEALRRAVADASRRGVDVRLLLPDEHTDAKPLRQATHGYLEELMEAGVKVYEYQPTMMHTKHIVVDGQWSVVGSANMDIRSAELNEENVLGILDPAFGAEMDRVFLEDLKHAEEIKLDAWRQRSGFKKVMEKLCRVFLEQY